MVVRVVLVVLVEARLMVGPTAAKTAAGAAPAPTWELVAATKQSR